VNKGQTSIFKYFSSFVLKSREHSDGRQNASSFCASIVTAERVRDAAGWNTIAADKVLYAARWNTPTADKLPSPTAEILQQPTEYFRNLRTYYDGRHSTLCDRMEYSNGRQSARHYGIEYSNGRQNTQCYKMEYSHGRPNT
jgi:hypothetical protein